MTVLIDPPAWPAHGMLWSHLASDASLEELHAFAEAAGIPRRGFDLDHYDVPQTRYTDLVISGAVEVGSKELLRRLQASGLRIRQIDKAATSRRQRKIELRSRWVALGHEVTGRAERSPQWHDLGEDLLLRWSEPHRHYHDLSHLMDVLLSLDLLGALGAPVGAEVLLAAWFHDAVYAGSPGVDERASAALAGSALGDAGLAPARVARVALLVESTLPGGVDAVASGTPPGSRAATLATAVALRDDPGVAVLGDADLAVFALPPKRYAAYLAGIRAEYAHVPDEAFRFGRQHIVRSYLERNRIYRTDVAARRWEEPARRNLAAELAGLTGSGGQA